MIGIGGVIVNSPNPIAILEAVEASKDEHLFAKPKHPAYRVDKRYVFSAMGLLSQVDKELALSLLKNETSPA